MTQRRLPFLPFLARSWLLGLLMAMACGQEAPDYPGPTGTSELREALFDSILARTARRGAFSVPKQEALGFDPLEEMEQLRDEVVAADSEEDLFYALLRLSNARRDRHLSVALVEGGIRPPFTDGLDSEGGPETADPLEAPVRFLPDFSEGEDTYFVSDLASAAEEPASEKEGITHDGSGLRSLAPDGLEPGDRVAEVNGLPVGELEQVLAPYIRHSSIPGLRWKIAQALSLRTAILPPSFRGESLLVEVEKADGSRARADLPYLDPEGLVWSGYSEPVYDGFALEWSTPTYDLYLPVAGEPALVLQWHRFESSSLIQDIDRLAAFGQERGLLDHAVIFDATRSGGGSLGAYAVQRIQPKPFKTTFGTLRLSDVIEPFIQGKREEFEAEAVFDSGGPETVDDGTWLMDWLENDVFEALEAGDSVTSPVPFKLAHAPKDSDGVLEPAPVHFRGPLIVFSGPNGGSHLDQFMSIVADNELGPIIGMPAGGYSNTWEWYEVLHFPGTYEPVVGFMWSIGHTIRPNGEVLEGNPAPVDEWVPLTAGNAGDYYGILLARARDYLESIVDSTESP
jgi:hypothetical protein